MLYDVAIIGAGPAGATLARRLAEACPEAKLLVVDAQAVGRPKVCGGLLSEDAQELLARMGMTLPSSILADTQVFSVETIDLVSGLSVSYTRNYLNMDRLAFDRYLVSLIPERVDIIDGKCTAIEATEDGYGITVYANGEHSVYSARQIVGADGASSLVRRTFFKRKIFRYVSIQEWFENPDESLPPYSCIFDKKTSDSCSWTIRKGKHYIFGGAFARQGCRAAFEEQKKRLEAYLGKSLGTPVRIEACRVCSPRSGRDILTGMPGVHLIGEAAGLISASSFEGISSAIMSGKLLADAFRDAALDPDRTAKLYRRYTRSLRRKMTLKIPKMRVLTSPTLRYLIMKSGVTSIEKFDT